MMVQCVELPPVTLPSHIKVLVQLPDAALHVQLSADVPSEGTKGWQDDPRPWALATHVGDPNEVLAPGFKLASPGHCGHVVNQLEVLFLPLHFFSSLWLSNK